MSAGGHGRLASDDLIDEFRIGRVVELQIVELCVLIVALRVRYADLGRLVLGRRGQNGRLLLLVRVVEAQLAFQVVPRLRIKQNQSKMSKLTLT